MRVFLVRHAEAEPGRPDEPDELRRLTSHGRDQARDLGRRFAGEGETLDTVISSPLVRARETAEAIAKALDVEPQPDDRLGPGCTADDLREAVHDRGATVVAVGHQPDCSEIASALGVDVEGFAPAAWVEIELP